MNQIREQAVLLGPRKSLVGIISAAPKPLPDAPMIVILNAGIIHRIGANRMHVPLARALAAAGFAVLRFDLSGIGDSETRVDALSPLEGSLADVQDVLDSLESTRQVRRFVLVGLCSGADHALLYSGRDKRVVGIALLDPSVPRTRGYYQRYYLRRLLRTRSWLNLLRGRNPVWRRLRSLPSPRQAGGDDQVAAAASLQSPEAKAFLQNAYQGALANDNQMLALFTEGREDIHNYREQLVDAFPTLKWGKQLELDYFYECDHTFTTETCQKRLIEVVVSWVRKAAFSPRS